MPLFMGVVRAFLNCPWASIFQTENSNSIVSPLLIIISDVIAENTQEMSTDKQNLTQLSAGLGSKSQHSLFAR